MDLTNIPWRAYEKYRRDGLWDLLYTGQETVLTNILFYRLYYQGYLRDRLPILDQAELLAHRNCRVYETYNEPVTTKEPIVVENPTTPEAQYEAADRFVCELPDATLFGPAGPGLTDGNRVIAETVGTTVLADRRVGVGVARAMTHTGVGRIHSALAGDATTDARFGTASVALPPWNNYYHWTIECLPRIRLLDKYAADVGEYPDLIVPADRPAWMDETLSLIDYAGRVVEWGSGLAHVDQLVVPSFPDPIPPECRWLRDRMRVGAEYAVDADMNVNPESNRVYLSRTDATTRRVRNFEQIRPILDAHGFEPYVLSDLDVSEQIALFTDADTVVAPHGAGLTNIVYADNLAILELFGDKKIGSFARLAEMLDHTYASLDCKQSGVNLVVDPDRLDSAIKSLLAGR
jgi:hypothetical protein